MKTPTAARLLVLLFLIIGLSPVFAQVTGKAPRWGDFQKWGDQKNGTYINPVLPGDYSDLDCIRVGADYYAVSSTFQYSPGFIILHSKDLVNWSILSHAVNDITQISPQMNWDKMNRYGYGIWAGAIRYHANKFWIYFCTPDEGYFMTSAVNPKGPWEPLHKVLAGKGWDDCAPFWDDDGQGYLAGTNFKDNYKIHLFKLTADGKILMKGSDKVIHQSEGSEANKFYKVKGIYYHLFSEVKPEGRVVMMERSKNIYGPYRQVKQLNHAQKEYMEPNQGGLVQTQTGSWFFLTHHGTGDWSGRNMSLLPVTWINGWPILGQAGKDGIGTMVWQSNKPVANTRLTSPQASDDFDSSRLAEQWEWNYQPRTDKWSLTARPGYLRLYAFKPIETDDLLKAGNTLTQRSMRTVKNEAVIKIFIGAMADGEKAGLTHFGAPDYSSIGVACTEGVKTLFFEVKGKIGAKKIIPGDQIWLKSIWGLTGISKYYYSLDGKKFTAFGDDYRLMWGSYRGDRIGIYNYNNKAEKGYIDVDYFNYQYAH